MYFPRASWYWPFFTQSFPSCFRLPKWTSALLSGRQNRVMLIADSHAVPSSDSPPPPQTCVPGFPLGSRFQDLRAGGLLSAVLLGRQRHQGNVGKLFSPVCTVLIDQHPGDPGGGCGRQGVPQTGRRKRQNTSEPGEFICYVTSDCTDSRN